MISRVEILTYISKCDIIKQIKEKAHQKQRRITSMSRIQLTKKEARARIDAILEEQFNLCVQATYNELIQILNENARAGKKKIKGILIVGFNPFASDSEDIVFDIDKNEIVQLWSDTLGGRRASLKTLEKYPKKYDVFCWHYDKYCTFALKFFTGWLPWSKTNTGKLFVSKLNEKLAGSGMKIKCSWNGLVTQFKIVFSCSIKR